MPPGTRRAIPSSVGPRCAPTRLPRNELDLCPRGTLRVRSYQHKCTGSHQNSEVNRAWARAVLGWVTSWEVLVLHPSLLRLGSARRNQWNRRAPHGDWRIPARTWAGGIRTPGHMAPREAVPDDFRPHFGGRRDRSNHKNAPTCTRPAGPASVGPGAPQPVSRGTHLTFARAAHGGCDHTSTNAPDPIRTPKLSVLGREQY